MQFGVLTPFVIGFVAFGLTLLLGTQGLADIQFPAWSKILSVYLLSFFFIALGEEPGFRGFALPRLMAGRSALAASLIVGILHAIWHLPLVIWGGAHPLDLLHPLCGAILLTWIFNKTNGSVFIAMLIHARSRYITRLIQLVVLGDERHARLPFVRQPRSWAWPSLCTSSPGQNWVAKRRPGRSRLAGY